MKNTAVKFGLYSAITILVLFLFSFFFLEGLSFASQEVVGYLSMFIALSFVFFGIKSHRDNLKDQKITFRKALGIGLLIVLFPSIVFGLFNAFYVLVLNPDFAEQYFATMSADLATQFSGAELEAKLEEARVMMEFGASPFWGSLLMGVTVFLLGFIVSLISAVILKRT